MRVLTTTRDKGDKAGGQGGLLGFGGLFFHFFLKNSSPGLVLFQVFFCVFSTFSGGISRPHGIKNSSSFRILNYQFSPKEKTTVFYPGSSNLICWLLCT